MVTVRRLLIVTSAATAVAAFAGVAAALVMPAATAAPAAVYVRPAPPAAYSCVLGAEGTDVNVQVSGPDAECGTWITALAGNGLNWEPAATAAPDVRLACRLASAGTVLTVMDSGQMLYGDDVCSQEEKNGWEPASY